MTLPTAADRKILSVSQLNRSAKNLLETYLPILWVEGEISNFSQPSSGHWYFTLKDNKAQVRCAMFRNRNSGVKINPKQGDKILVRGTVSLYEGRGDYQLIAEHMEPAGRGDLQQQFEALKNALQAQGLFDASRKKPLPTWPSTIGIITSPTGAAVHDILNVLKRRAPNISVRILPVAVQGADAAAQIAQAIQAANQHTVCDTLIVGRGGGSLEDLWAFNEEIVAQAIYQSKIPIISAVGHEVDFSIADFVADARAPTPSAAAELASPNQKEALQNISQLRNRLLHLISQQISAANYRLSAARNGLRHPGENLKAQAQTLDQLEIRMLRALNACFERRRNALRSAANALTAQSPRIKIHYAQATLANTSRRLVSSTTQTLKNHKQRFQHAAGLLQSVSPLNTLQRGYTIVFNAKGRTLATVQNVKKGETIKTRFVDGEISALVTDVSKT